MSTPQHVSTVTTAVTGRAASRAAVAVVRIVVGLVFMTTGLPKLTLHAAWAADFERWHVPLPDLAVTGAGTLELVGGLALVLGVGSRWVASALSLQMVAAALFAGLTDGGQHLILPPALAVATAVVAWTGGGAWQLRPASRLRRR